MDNKDLQAIVLDKMTKVCVCKAISRAKIKDSIESGANTLDKVIKDTGACTGSCKGSRCKYKIENLITELTK
jgi:bacterioferritin-associated ferredoxin